MTKPSYPLPPGSLGLPLIGETVQFLLSSNFGDKREKQYGSIYKTNILGRKTVFMTGAEKNGIQFSRFWWWTAILFGLCFCTDGNEDFCFCAIA